MPRKSAPDETLRLPVTLRSVSNGEFEPRPTPQAVLAVERTAFQDSFEHAKRLGVSRRKFLGSTSAVATVLLAMNELGCGGGQYNVPKEAPTNPEVANAALNGEEFIFDVQTHRVSTSRDWQEQNWQFKNFGSRTDQGKCGEADFRQCYSTDRYIRSVFLESDTSIAVMSSLPGAGDKNPLHIEEAVETRETLQKMAGTPRLLLHAIVQPNIGSTDAELERMHKLSEQFPVAAWKLYTVWGAEGTGYWLDDEKTGIRVIEQAQALKIPLLAIHKGLPLAGMDPTYTRPRDVGPVAKRYPNVTFLIYHSAYEHDYTEGPYDPKSARGCDALIRTLEEHDIGKNGNVYAELGAVWHALLKKPDEAAHFLGKLLKHIGEDRILWGTDAIWFGSPQDQIQAFRSFEISPEYQERYGYPALTPERKAKVFGLNAARVYGVDIKAARLSQRGDVVQRVKTEFAWRHSPRFETYGPTTRREFLELLRHERKL